MIQIISFNKENKKEIAKTIALLFDSKNNIPDYLKTKLLDSLLWATTEYNDSGKKDKYFGQPFWSERALKQILINKKSGVNLEKDLRHEHAVPKKLIKDKILTLKNKSEEEIFNILDKLGHAVIISKDEDEKLNRLHRSSSPNLYDVFSRYKTQKEIIVRKLPDNFNLKDFDEEVIKDFEPLID